MIQRSHVDAEYPGHITFSKFKYKLQNLITEVRQLREKEQNTRRELEILVQKQRNDESEQQKKFGALHAEIAAADKIRSNLENKVKDLQNEVSIMANKQKESKGVIDSLLQSKDKLTNDLKASNYELKRDIDTKESELAILKGRLSRNLALLEAVEREVVCVKLAIDETCQILQGKEDKVLGLKQKLDTIMGYEKLFIEKNHLLENQMEEKQIESSKKDTVIADLKDRLEYMMNDRKLELQIGELQKLVEVKEDAIQNLILEKEELLSEVQSLELVLSKFQDLQMETSPKRLLESQEVDYALQKQIPKVAEETPIQQNHEECKRDEKENNNSENERSELLPQIHDLTDNNTKYCDRGSSPYLTHGDNLNQYQRDSYSTNEMQMRSKKVCLGTRGGESQCGQTFTLSKDSVELAASKNESILQALQVNVRSSPIPEVTHRQTVRTHRNIAKSICCRVKADNIDSVFLKSDQSGFSSAASEKTDLYPYALDHCASSHSSSSSSPSLNTNGPASTLIGEVSSKTNVKEEREQQLNSSYETATNITEENKKVTDAEYQIASKNAKRKDTVTKGSKQEVDSVNQAAFEYAINGANVIEENKTVMDLTCCTPFPKVASVTERREQALDLANHTALFDEKNKTNGLEESQQALDSAYQNGSNTENSTEENKEILDSVDQIGVHNQINHGNFREENDQVFDSAYSTAFCNEAKRSRFMNHGIVPDSMQERVTSPLVCTHLTSLPAVEVKIQCSTEMDNSFTAEKKFNCNFNGIETNITESSRYVQENCDDNSPTSKVSPLPTKGSSKDSSYRDMVKCVICEQLLYDTCLNLERKGLDKVRLTNFNYTCQNCKNEHGKKRRNLGLLTPELASERDG